MQFTLFSPLSTRHNPNLFLPPPLNFPSPEGRGWSIHHGLHVLRSNVILSYLKKSDPERIQHELVRIAAAENRKDQVQTAAFGRWYYFLGVETA